MLKNFHDMELFFKKKKKFVFKTIFAIREFFRQN